MKKNLLKTIALACYMLPSPTHTMMNKMPVPPSRASETLCLANGESITLSMVHTPTDPHHHPTPKKISSLEQEILLLNNVLYRGSHTGTEDCFWASAYLTTHQGKVMVGTIIYQVENDREAYVHLLAVDPSHQKKGIGTALMNYVEKTFHCTTIELTPWGDAQSFYENLGYLQQEKGHLKKNLL